MGFVQDTLDAPRPDAIRSVALPRRSAGFPSPVDWRDQVIYFLLPDRFSNGQEAGPAARSRASPASIDRPASAGIAGQRRAAVASRAARSPGSPPTSTTSQRPGRYRRSGSARSSSSASLATLPRLRHPGLPAKSTRGSARARIWWSWWLQPRIGANARPARRGLQPHRPITGSTPTASDQPPYLPWPQLLSARQWRDRRGWAGRPHRRPDDGVWPAELQARGLLHPRGRGQPRRGRHRRPARRVPPHRFRWRLATSTTTAPARSTTWRAATSTGSR